MKICGLDSSMTGFGYALLATDDSPYSKERPRVLAAGVWETWPDKVGGKSVTEDNNDRFFFLATSLWSFVSEMKPDRVFIEGTVYIPGKMTAGSIHALGRVRGFADVISAGLNIETIELSVATVKGGLGIIHRDEGKASKDEVRKRIEKLYPEAIAMIPKGHVGENAADAIAVAHVGITRTAFSDRLQSGSSQP